MVRNCLSLLFLSAAALGQPFLNVPVVYTQSPQIFRECSSARAAGPSVPY